MSKKKVTLIAFIMAFLVVGAAVVSYSISRLGGGEANLLEDNISSAKAAAVTTNYTSNIDLIIEDSNDNKTYNIVEIVSSNASASDLAAYINNGTSELFKTNVIDANKSSTTTDNMKSGAIKYDAIQISASTSLDDKISSNITGESSKIRTILDNADMIYISSPTYSAYATAMNEDIYNYLHTYALGKNRPVIVDYVTSSDDGTTVTSKKYKDIVNVISNNYIRFKTFEWTESLSAIDFFSRKSGSYYVYFDTNKTPASGKVLVVTDDQTEATSMYAKMEAGDFAAIQKKAYYGNGKPSAFSYEFRTSSSLTAADLNGYDFVLLENSIMEKTITDEVYSALKTLSESGKYILYDNRSTSSSSSSSTVSGTNNYAKLLSLLLTDKGVSRYSHILAVTNGYFTSLKNAGATGTEGAKPIADIINAGEYRDASKTGAGGRKFTVLEIQPCYPIDLELATKDGRTATSKFSGSGKKYGGAKYKNDPSYVNNIFKDGVTGGYYTLPDQVVYGYAKDELAEDTEYYSFELSKTKMAYALGINYDEVDVVQMSVNELISSKEVVLENYDLVYIGGDHSAFVPWFMVAYGDASNYNITDGYDTLLDNFTKFDMYTHTDNFVDLQQSNAFNSVTSGTNSVEFSGHDINSIKKNEIVDYLDAGLPIMVDKTVADAFAASYAFDPDNKQSTNKSRLEQLKLHDIDPDCFMYQALEEIYGDKSKGNVAWGIDLSSAASETQLVEKEGDTNSYGRSTIVYTDAINTQIANVVTSGAKRPTLKLKAYPTEYEEGNDSAVNTDETATFTAVVDAPANADTTATTGSYTVTLYVDKNGDGIFSDSGEKITSKECSAGTAVDLSYKLEAGYFGLLSWKVKVVDSTGVLCDSKAGVSLYKLSKRKTVKLLQIVPAEKAKQGEWTSNSLYFCTECQQANKVLENNITVRGKNQDADPGYNSSNNGDTIDSVYLGKHEHHFGIVKYDTNTRTDDWEDNLAYDIMHGKDDGLLESGEFDIQLDIVTPSQFDAWCQDAIGRSDTDSADKKDEADDLYKQYLAALEAEELVTARNKLEDELYTVIQNNTNLGDYDSIIRTGIGTDKDHPGKWMMKGENQYYKFFEYCNSSNQANNITGIQAVKDAYAAYITEYDKVVALKERYKETSRKNGNENTWLINNYNMIVLGMADEFYNNDLSQTCCDQLLAYVKRDGSMLNTHDTMSKYNYSGSGDGKGGGAYRLTKTLREEFGMDRFHVTTTDTSKNLTLTASTVVEQEATIAKQTITGSDKTYRVYWGNEHDNTHGHAITVGTQDVSIETWGSLKVNDDDILGITYSDPVESGKVTVTVKIKNGSNWKSSMSSIDIYNDNDVKVATSNSQTVHGNDVIYKVVLDPPIEVQNTDYTGSIKVSNKDVTVDTTSGTATITEEGTAKASASEKLSMKILTNEPADTTIAVTYSDGTVFKGVTDSDGTVVINNVSQSTKKVSQDITLGDDSFTFDWELSTNTANQKDKVSSSDSTYTITVVPKSNGIVIESGSVTWSFRGSTQTESYTGGKAIITIDASDADSTDLTSILGYSGTPKYRIYSTKDKSKYFWTMRYKATNDAELKACANAVGGYMKYNAPIGMSDLYASYDSSSNFTSPFIYCAMADEAFNHRANADNINWEVKYGTRQATQVNKGGLTMYPFMISEELRISPTHAQMFSLDIEDPTVCVWYTLAPNYVTEGTDAKPTSVNAYWSRYDSSFYAASPRDGMNNYFLYSKENVFYCGVGHQIVTGKYKDNNDERRLYINIIVNKVQRGESEPELKLYNVCDKYKKDTAHDADCEDYYVNPSKVDENDELSKEKDKLYWNKSIEMYQYNIDNTEDDLYPQFDFRALMGNASFEKIEVFYDLNYGDDTSKGQKKTDDFETGKDSMIIKYTKAPNTDSGHRNRLRESDTAMKADLLLKDDYTKNYEKKYTYIVIKVTDVTGAYQSARVKINILPHLFDLTDTSIDYRYQSIKSVTSVMDVTDRIRFYI